METRDASVCGRWSG